MIETYHVIIAVIIIIVLLFIYTRSNKCDNVVYEKAGNRFSQQRSDSMKKESFDTHRNHGMAAQSIYAKKDPEITLNEAERDARYGWSARDTMGYQLYDKFYEQKVEEEYDYAETYTDDYNYDNDNQYDLKFETSGTQGYSQAGMREPQLRGTFRGNIITLAQKERW